MYTFNVRVVIPKGETKEFQATSYLPNYWAAYQAVQKRNK